MQETRQLDINDVKNDPIGSSAFCRAVAQVWLDQQLKRMAAGEIFAELATLTPELAKLLLEHNPDNRGLSVTVINNIIRDNKEGHYELNGATIVVADTGELNDGQNRCEAVVQSGQGIETFIVFGVSRDSRMTTDLGRVKTPGHVLKMNGIANSNTAAHAYRLLCQYDALGYISKTQERPTKAMITDKSDADPGLAHSVRVVAAGRKIGLSHGLLAFCHYLFSGKSSAAADAFMHTLITGIGITESNDPIHILRERLQRNKNKKIKEQETVECIFRAWNMYRVGRSATKIHTSGRLPELR